MAIRGWNEKPKLRHFYLLKIRLKEERFEEVLPVVSAPEAEMLVGRDILNKLNLLLEGKRLSLHIIGP